MTTNKCIVRDYAFIYSRGLLNNHSCLLNILNLMNSKSGIGVIFFAEYGSRVIIQ